MTSRKTAFFTAFIFLISMLCGCTETNADYNKSDNLSIVTTCFPPYDFARAVKGDDENLTMLLCAGAEAHSYEPTPLDILEIQQCDIFIYIGGEGEVWADEILNSIDTSDKYILKLSDYAELLDEIDITGVTEHENNNFDDEDEFDEHIWTSPKNAVSMTSAICDVLCEVDSENSEKYISNSNNYIDKLNKLDSDFDDMTSNAPNNLLVIGDRFPFRYLTAEYNLNYYSAFSGCSSESEPSVYTMAFLIDKIIENKVTKVFYLEFSTKKVAEKLCDATQTKLLPLQSCHNVSKEDFQNGVTYIDLMYRNFDSIKEALYD